jgi:hypothetical protein
MNTDRPSRQFLDYLRERIQTEIAKAMQPATLVPAS